MIIIYHQLPYFQYNDYLFIPQIILTKDFALAFAAICNVQLESAIFHQSYQTNILDFDYVMWEALGHIASHPFFLEQSLFSLLSFPL